MDRVFKIVVTGPFDSGKTTFIGSISEIDVVSTEKSTRTKSGAKVNTTVAMDFGRITFDDGYILHLYGTPGQGRFDFMWEILSEGMLGYVVLVDGSSPETFEDGKSILESFLRISKVPFVVGMTRGDHRNCADVEELAARIGLKSGIDVIRCDARSVSDVKNILISLLEKVEESAEAVERAG